jgi:hypothetical protein
MPSGTTLVGRRFGKLRVLHETKREDVYIVECSCGNQIEVWRSQLTKQVVRECGCSHRGKLGTRHTRSFCRRDGSRGTKYTGEYLSWKSAKERCTLPVCSSYKTYGALGIRMCESWLGKDGFRMFLAAMGPRPVGKTLDRVNPFGNYEPGNCRWADCETQTFNKRANYIAPLVGPEYDVPAPMVCDALELEVF